MNSSKRQELDMNNKKQGDSSDWNPIYSYSRAQALKDGVLVNAGELAKEAGFTFPIALTAAVHAAYVKVPDEVYGQDESGRLWDILSMLRFAIKKQTANGPICRFQLYAANNDDYPAELITLKAHCGPGDNLEPVLTIMLPNED